MTTGTVTSAALLAQRLPALGLEVARAPPVRAARRAGLGGAVSRPWAPDAAGFVESEVWPNLIAACRRRGIPMMLVNARLSPRSFARWRLAPGLALALFAAFERSQAQSEDDAERLRALGTRNVSAPGNLKFAAGELPADAAELARLRALLRGRPVWLAASTHPGEEAIAAAVHAALRPPIPACSPSSCPATPSAAPPSLPSLSVWR